MAVATLWVRRESCQVASRGDLTWAFRVNGLIYSNKTALKKQFPGFQEGKSDLLLSLPTAQELVPIDKELHGVLEGDLPPIALATQILKALAEMNYKIITMTSSGNDSGRMKEFIWTLQLGV